MIKKLLSLTLLSLLLLLLLPYPSPASAHNAGFPSTYDPSVLTIDTIVQPESLDPAWIYDETSGEVIMNVYENLIFFDRIYTDSGGYYQAGKTDLFVPKLATSWSSKVIDETSPEGLHWTKRFTFAIRTGVPFHNGAPLTTEDVEYSFERWLVQDRAGGAQWMVYLPLFDCYEASSPTDDPLFGLKIDHAVENNATHVWFNMVLPTPDKMFLQILAQPWSSIVNKAWCQAKGDLKVESVPGGWSNWAQIYNTWHDPPMSFIEGDMMGTGPYRFSQWDWWGAPLSIVKFDNYWDGWPARKAEGSNERLPGCITTVVWNYATSWTTRQSRFLAGTSDMTTVPRMHRDQVLGQPGIRCWYGTNPPESLPGLSVTAAFFTLDINTLGGSNYYAPIWYPPNTFGPNGIPPNIFGKHTLTGVDEGLNVRKGFAYAFDYDTWIATGYLGEATHPTDPVIPGLTYDNPSQAGPTFNLTKAEYYLKLAWGGIDSRSGVPSQPVLPEDPSAVTPGALWSNGMSFRFYYNPGDVARQSAYEVFVRNVNSLNPLFQLLGPYPKPWGYILYDMAQHVVPIFIMGWLADYSDPDNFVFPFMHSQGIFAEWQRYSNPRVDDLIRQGAVTPDDTAPYNGELDKSDPRPYFNVPSNIPPDTRWPRRSIYYELQAIYAIDDFSSITLIQPIERHWERDWMRGWYNNPIYSGLFVYHLWKAKTHFGDANNDGVVDVFDAAVISAHWYPDHPSDPTATLQTLT